MNREILFRGKRIDNGEWVEGCLFDGVNYCLIGNTIKFNPNNEHEQKIVGFIIDRETVCQCTGLTDKKDKKIWENDILCGHGNEKDLSKATYGEFGIIDVETLEVIDTAIGWHYEVIPTDAVSKCEPFCLSMPLTDAYIKRCEFEVIGNIFDNPELSEVW